MFRTFPVRRQAAHIIVVGWNIYWTIFWSLACVEELVGFFSVEWMCVCVWGEQNYYTVHWSSAWIYCRYSRYWIKWQLCAFVGWNCENWNIMHGMDHIKFPEMETVSFLWSTNWLWIWFRQTPVFLRINSVFVIVLLWFKGNAFVLFLAILWSGINLFTCVKNCLQYTHVVWNMRNFTWLWM